jgi:hypothetical protein
MRSLKSGLIALAISGVFGAAAVVGCSASGDSGGIGQDGTGTDPNVTPPSNVLPPENPGGDPPPDPVKDAGKKDTGVDAGPPPPNPGDPCPKADAIAKKPCGACGTAEAICTGDAEAGTLKWSEYGQCQGEIAGGCTPTTTGACGNCGTQTCSKYCAWGACSEPAGACKSGSTDYSTAGCATPNTYRNRTCDATCKWSGFSATCDAPNNPNKMTVPAAVNTQVQTTWNFTAADVGNRLGPFAGCPAASVDSGKYPYVIVEVHNPTAQKATVTIQSLPGTNGLDVVIYAFNKTLPPPDDASMEACDYQPTDDCPAGSGVTCPASGYWGGLMGVTINAGASVLVYLASYYATDAGFGTSTGSFNLVVRTTGLM